MSSKNNPSESSKRFLRKFPDTRLWRERARDWLGALLAIFAATASLSGADAKMSLPRENLMEISGGAGARAWTIRYGTGASYQKKLVNAAANRAWISHGGWLRLIDAERGVVVGRWHFPGSIVQLTSAGKAVQLQLEEKEGERVFTRLITFDPEGESSIRYWPSGSLMLNRVPIIEGELTLVGNTKTQLLFEDWKPGAGLDLKQLIPQLEEAVRRDPLSPAIRVALWRLLREVNDPRAASVLEEALNVKTTDFTELLPISSLLESLNETEAARKAFESGYRDFLDKGSDPRLMTALIGKLILYRSRFSTPLDFKTDRGREIMERHYRLGPYCESADLAWAAYARIMEASGRAQDARKWRARADEATHTSVFLLPRKLTLFSDSTLLAIIAALAATFLYFAFMWIRYRPQRRADRVRMPGRGLPARILAAFSFQHWSLGQRVAFFSIVLIVWIGLGIEAGLMRGVIRVAATPLNMTMGSMAGSVSPWYFENRVPASPQRDLMLAYAHQQNGQLDRAERLYRALPEFAESWNNLGIILRGKNQETEAKQAFEKALALDPALGEAALNLGQPPRGIWVEQFARYFPGRPMLAPPKPERISEALFGGSFSKVCLRGLAGPFADWESFGSVFFMFGYGSENAPAADVFTILILAVSVLAVALLFLPRKAATELPARSFVIPEVLFPGLTKAWGFLGGWALLAWAFFILQGILIAQIGTPYILSAIAEPNLTRAYNLPPEENAYLLQLFNPSWTWVYLAPLVLFVINLILVMMARRAGRNTPSPTP